MKLHLPSIRILLFILAGAVFSNGVLPAQEEEDKYQSTFELHGYGTFNYFVYDWKTDPYRRNAIDLERLVLYPVVHLAPQVLLRAEIEFEHGGTGVTMEFDRFEEFGEFEQEVEKGGEVILDQLHVQVELEPEINFRVGRIRLPVGVLAYEHEPTEYFTTTRPEMETSLIPSIWYENGIEMYGHILAVGALEYHLLIVNGLDATGFSSATWVRRGIQKRFEFVNAEDFAFVAGLQYAPTPSLAFGGSVYYGNSANNRPKPDLNVDAHVGVYEGHAVVKADNFELRAMGMYGSLENADLVSQANRNLSNNLNVKRTPVGSAAAGASVESGYDILSFLGEYKASVFAFLRLEYYDSMARVKGDVFDNPRWERRVWTAGMNYKPLQNLVVKGQYSQRRLESGPPNIENTFSVGVGFEFE
jgi:opacity protein-like surface antigen